MIILTTLSCTKKFDLTEHFDPLLPFEIIDQEHPSGVLSQTEIQVNDSKHVQLTSWLTSNNQDWRKAPHNTHAGLIIVGQGDFRILFYRDDNKVVIAYNNEENEMQQFIRDMDSNELRFLLDD